MLASLPLAEGEESEDTMLLRRCSFSETVLCEEDVALLLEAEMKVCEELGTLVMSDFRRGGMVRDVSFGVDKVASWRDC